MAAPKKGRGRPRTGSAIEHGDHYDVRITLPDGTRSTPRCLPPGLTYARAREIAAAMTERAAEQAQPQPTAPAPAPEPETFEAWAVRWCADREARGLTSVDDDRGRLRKWVHPALGKHPVVAIAKSELEDLVEQLDRQVAEGELSWKTATNVWGLVTKAFADAAASKTRALRLRNDNPAEGVRGPDRGAKASKAYLWPSEMEKLATCHRVPRLWRRMYIVTAYLYLRAAELRALEWPDLDLNAGVILVHRTEDDDGNLDTTKGQQTRRFAIEPVLLPMLRAMRDHARNAGRVFPNMPSEKHLSPMFRRHLLAAGVTRADLHAGDATRRRIRFHDLRATGLSWAAIRGDDPLKIMHRAGHADFQTTQGYIREAEAVRAGFGAVFPQPPPELFSSGFSSERLGANNHAYEIREENRVESKSGRRDLNPGPNADTIHATANFPHDSHESSAAAQREPCANETPKCASAGGLTKIADGNPGAPATLLRPVLGMSAGWDEMDALLLRLEEMPDPEPDDSPVASARGTTGQGRRPC